MSHDSLAIIRPWSEEATLRKKEKKQQKKKQNKTLCNYLALVILWRLGNFFPKGGGGGVF